MKTKSMQRVHFVLLLLFLFFFSNTLFAQRMQQKPGRGVVAIQNGSNVVITWRRLAQDPEDCKWNVYSDGNKLNSQPLSTSNMTTTTTKVPVGAKVMVTRVVNGNEDQQSAEFIRESFDYRNIYMSINFEESGSPLSSADYNTSYVWPADLDGDGEMDYVVDRSSLTNVMEHYVEGYLRTGEHLWSVRRGPNERQNNQVCAVDMDCDGYADVIMQSSDGTQFWDPDKKDFGLYVNGNSTGDTDGDGIIDYETQNVRNAPHYMSVIDGRTGREKTSTEMSYNQWYNRTNRSSLMGDEYNNHVGNVGIFYHDGIHPAIVLLWHTRDTGGAHHYYHMAFAYDFADGNATTFRELFQTQPGGTSFHQIRIGDPDEDGRDEMIDGGFTMDHDGSTLFNAGIGHGDRFRTSDIDPERPGLETFAIQQDAGDMLGQILYDAETGEPIKKWYLSAVGDVGRGECMDIDSDHLGWEMWSTMSGVYDSKGDLISGLTNHYPCEGIWWDGDLGRENVGSSDSHYNTYIEDYNSGRLIQMAKESGYRYVAVYAKRACFWGDIIGDWREEIVLRHMENGVNVGIVGFTTDIPTSVDNIYYLQQDPHYAGDCTTKGYYQSPNPGFYLGFDMPRPQLPPVMVTDYVLTGKDWSPGSSSFSNYRRSPVSYSDGKSVLLDLYTPDNITLSGSLSPSCVYAMPVKKQIVSLNGTGSLTGEMDFWKSQAGTVVMNAPVLYTGQTVISEGTLVVNNDLTSSSVSLRARGTLAGKGRVGDVSFEGALHHQGCRLQPSGTFTFAKGLNINEKVYLEIDSQEDLIEVEGDFHLSGSLILKVLADSFNPEPGEYKILHFTGKNDGKGTVSVTGLRGFSYKTVVEDGYLKLVINKQRDPSDSVWWTGEKSDTWDYLTENFIVDENKTEFVSGDAVCFGDNATTTNVRLDELMVAKNVTVTGSKNFTMDGDGGISGSASLVKEGTGTLTFNVTKSDYTGKTIINGGVLAVKELADAGVASSLGAAAVAPENIQIGNATMRVNNVNASTDRGITLTGSANINVPDGTLALKGKIIGTGSLTKSGNGQLNFNNNGNSWSGGTILAGGAIAMGSWDVRFGAANSPINVSENSSIVVFNNNSSSAIPNLRHAITIEKGKTLTISGGARCMISGSLSGEGTLKISYPYVRGDFSTNTSNFHGTVEVTSGQFRITADTDLSNAVLRLDDGVYAVHTSVNSGTEKNLTTKIGSLVSTYSTATLSTGTWNVGYLGENDTYGGSFSSNAIINKYGDGNMTFTGTGSGPVNIYSGRVNANNASASLTSSTITVRNGGVLGGNGQVGVVNVMTGGTLCAGISYLNTGSLKVGSVTVSAGGILDVCCRKSSSGKVTCDNWVHSGRVSLRTPVIRVKMLGSNELSVGDELRIFSGTGTISLTGDATVLMSDGADGYSWDTSRLATEGIIVVAGVPEATSINNITHDDGSVKVYDLSGNQIPFNMMRAHTGVLLINGKKVIVRP
mgnify:CR=1 FL=1